MARYAEDELSKHAAPVTVTFPERFPHGAVVVRLRFDKPVSVAVEKLQAIFPFLKASTT